MPRTKKATYCGDCGAGFGPNVQPGRIPGLCDCCAPLHVVHLALAGDYATTCGTPMRDVNADDAQEVVTEMTYRINCTRCLDAHNARDSY